MMVAPVVSVPSGYRSGPSVAVAPPGNVYVAPEAFLTSAMGNPPVGHGLHRPQPAAAVEGGATGFRTKPLPLPTIPPRLERPLALEAVAGVHAPVFRAGVLVACHDPRRKIDHPGSLDRAVSQADALPVNRAYAGQLTKGRQAFSPLGCQS